MEVKKAIRKIVAVAAGATMMGATLFGALAADLSMYPAPFVKDGKFDAFIVVGDQAAAEDVVGAVDIGASLQFEMKKETTVSLGSADVLISDGIKIKGTGSEVLNYNESLGEVRDTPLDNEDLPVMLAEGRYVESEGATDNDETYTQELWLNNTNGIGLHDQPEDMVHGDYLELYDGDVLYKYVLQFDDPVEFETSAGTEGSREDDIEGTQIEIQGNIYTITDIKLEGGQNITDITLMAGETLLWLMQDQVIEKSVSGVRHEIKVVDVTDSEDSCGVSVDGDVAWIDVKSDKTINGVNIGVLDAKAVHAQLQDVDICELNIGATEIKIEDAFTLDPDVSLPGTITVDGDEIDGADVGIVNAGPGTWDALVIELTPDEDVFLATDEGYTDPVLGNFKFVMGGVATPREEISTKTSGSKKAEIKFTNNDGKDVKIPVFVNDSETGWGLGTDDDEPLLVGDGSVFVCGTVESDCEGVLLFALTSGQTAHILEIVNIDSDKDSIDLKDLTYGRTFNDRNYTAAISLGSLGSIDLDLSVAGTITVNDINSADGPAVTNYGADINLDPEGLIGGLNFNTIAVDTSVALFNLTERDIDDTDISLTDFGQTVVVDVVYDSADEELKVTLNTTGLVVEPTGGVDESEDNSDTQYYTTLHGTLIAVDDEDKDWVIINYPKEEVEINAFVAPVSAQISTSGGAIKSLELERLNVGAARLASEISDVTRDNLILVGGACANAATAAVQGVSMSEPDCLAGLSSGEAIVKLYEQSTGKVAMVVAGMDALDTRRATRVVANFDAYDLSGKEVKVTGTILTDIKVSMPS
ncbi:S-layer protein [Candidatus Woesearchaeota archaeon]|nr:S-layer protein [Candidatus Woesearchaeota archaeon]